MLAYKRCTGYNERCGAKAPFEMQEILNQAKATGEDTYKILSFAISVVGGLLDFEDSVYKLNCTDRAQLIVQVEYLKTLIKD